MQHTTCKPQVSHLWLGVPWRFTYYCDISWNIIILFIFIKLAETNVYHFNHDFAMGKSLRDTHSNEVKLVAGLALSFFRIVLIYDLEGRMQVPTWVLTGKKTK